MQHASIDISEIWDNAEFFAGVFIALGLIVLSLRIRRRWIRYPAILLTSLLFFGASGLAVLIGCDMVESNSRIPKIPSPDGKHVALVRWWLGGALASDMVHVSIRRAYSPFATEVLVDDGEPPESVGGLPDPKVEWLDNRTLLITYRDEGTIRPCSTSKGKVDGIKLLCRD